MSQFIVHAVLTSPFGRAVRATLEEKGADWALKEMKFGESKGDEHLAIHPFGKLPVLQHGQFTLYETQAILRYIDRVLPDPPLTPTDPQAAARMDQLMGINDHYLFPGCANVIVFQRLVAPMLPGVQTDLAAISAAIPRAHVVFGEISRILGDNAFLVGSTISLADLMIGSQIALFSLTPEWEELSAGRANLIEWLARLEQRPSFSKTRWNGPSGNI